MQLFILRHGEAVSEAPKDSLRELSALGRQEVAAAVNADKAYLDSVDYLIVSPYLRAQQTAKIVAKRLEGITCHNSDLLVPSGDPDQVIKMLYTLFHERNVNTIMLVGHQPLLGTLLDQLCALETGKHRLATASLAAVNVEVMAKGCCQLQWLHHTT
ncbi:phosphohistidine phosphatase SixA [Agarilytica rhodophyticola]|uniref:phosphohistidine phosphatase SixA n=1 Tax=Agarilytica rhodophyticola TaxID=1737490 RepID=UPI000B344493|nr:phosphohistidine phosphatase SixA [Agarilytica rhodophyticola]